MKKILPFALMICILLSVCFIPSTDADGESLWVNGVNIINPGGDPIPAGCSFDSTSNTLTLENVGNLTTMHSISHLGTQNAVIIDNRDSTPGLTIRIVGDNNTITSSGTGDYHGIYVTGDLTITGTGEITISTAVDGGSGIASFGTLSIDGPSITASGGTAPDIMGNDGITISSGSVDASLDSNDGITISGSSTVNATGIMLTAGTLAISDTATVDVDARIWCDDGMTVNGSPTITAWQILVNMSYATKCDLVIEGGTINITDTGSIDVDGDFTMSGGNIVFLGTLPDGDPAISATGGPTYDGVFRMTGGSITAGNGVAGRTLISASDNDPSGDNVLIYDGSNPLVNLTRVDNALNVTATGLASLSFPVTEYTVTFAANGGTGTMSPVSKSGEYTLPSNGFTAPAGKTFKCWSVVIGSAAAIEKNVGQTINVTANTTVSAVWQDAPAATFTVSFDANGGTGTMNPVTGVSGEYTLPECTFTAPDGKTFKCWSVGDTEKDAGDKITVTADTTVKAVWKDSSSGSSFPVGIVVGAVVGVIAVVGIGFFVLKKIGKI